MPHAVILESCSGLAIPLASEKVEARSALHVPLHSRAESPHFVKKCMLWIVEYRFPTEIQSIIVYITLRCVKPSQAEPSSISGVLLKLPVAAALPEATWTGQSEQSVGAINLKAGKSNLVEWVVHGLAALDDGMFRSLAWKVQVLRCSGSAQKGLILQRYAGAGCSKWSGSVCN